ncbi:hypothetical protein BC941DRAFT_518417 [Chlamydoabsidia padenii]|nr:hypothetical protein BC941DRAFT_518417 [Chlamydoabsidia padenii]
MHYYQGPESHLHQYDLCKKPFDIHSTHQSIKGSEKTPYARRQHLIYGSNSTTSSSRHCTTRTPCRHALICNRRPGSPRFPTIRTRTPALQSATIRQHPQGITGTEGPSCGKGNRGTLQNTVTKSATATPAILHPIHAAQALAQAPPSRALRQQQAASRHFTAPSLSKFGSLGLSVLGLDNMAGYTSPGEVCHTLTLMNLKAGYRDMVLPQLTVLATNIMSMHKDNLVSYVLKMAIIDAQYWFDTIDCAQLAADTFLMPIEIHTNHGPCLYSPLPFNHTTYQSCESLILKLSPSHFFGNSQVWQM